MTDKSERDRRQHPRYRVDDEVFLAFRPQFDRIGKLKDISQGGVAFEYTVFQESQPVQTAEIDIFSAAKDFHLPRVLCKIVYDVKLDSYPSFNNIVTRRCGLQFQDLSEQQAAQLQTLFSSPLPAAPH